MKKYGYSRISSVKGQTHDRQVAALTDEGIEADDIFYDSKSGKDADRAGLKNVISRLRGGDVLVVCELARLGRSLRDLKNICDEIEGRGAQLKSLKEEVNTNTPAGRLIFHTLGAIAEFERDLIRERQAEGIRLAQERGAYKGAKPKLKPEAADRLRKLRLENNISVADLAKMFGISRASAYKYLRS